LSGKYVGFQLTEVRRVALAMEDDLGDVADHASFLGYVRVTNTGVRGEKSVIFTAIPVRK
jgi:hypothetical protein